MNVKHEPLGIVVCMRSGRCQSQLNSLGRKVYIDWMSREGMEKFELDYEGYKIVFYLHDEIGLNHDLDVIVRKKLSDKHFWFEVVLFELIDLNEDGCPDDELGKKFIIALGRPLKNKGIKEDDYLQIKTPGIKISRGSTKIGEYLIPNSIYR